MARAGSRVHPLGHNVPGDPYCPRVVSTAIFNELPVFDIGSNFAGCREIVGLPFATGKRVVAQRTFRRDHNRLWYRIARYSGAMGAQWIVVTFYCHAAFLDGDYGLGALRGCQQAASSDDSRATHRHCGSRVAGVSQRNPLWMEQRNRSGLSSPAVGLRGLGYGRIVANAVKI